MKTFLNSTIKFWRRFQNIKLLSKFILLALTFYITAFQIKAQPVNARVNFVSSVAGFGTGTCFVTLTDSTGWTFISVELTDHLSDSTLFTMEYAFDQISGLPVGISWQRQGVDVILGIGTLTNSHGWTGKVKLQNTAGIWSDSLEFIFQ